MDAKIIICMLLLHFVADFTLQGCLAQMKQKEWWIKQCVEYDVRFEDYRHDYVVALICHALYWSILTFLPLWWLSCNNKIIIAIIGINAIAHAVIDDLKANLLAINLKRDQILHLFQIIFTYIVFKPFINI